MSTGERDCQHVCCDDRGNPFHDHFLPAEQCSGCERVRTDDPDGIFPDERDAWHGEVDDGQ